MAFFNPPKDLGDPSKATTIGPGLEDSLEAMARNGIRRVTVATPGFVSDCVETLEEVAIRAGQAFREAGDPFDSDTSRRLEDHILSVGGTREAAELYTAFRGRMPGPEALLRGRGLGV